MKYFTTALFLSAFLALSIMPVKILGYATVPFGADFNRTARPHEVWDNCGTACRGSCQHPVGPNDPCAAMCIPGWVCETGYIRNIDDGSCVLPSDCPAAAAH